MWQRLLGILLIVIALAGVATWVYFGSTDNTPSEKPTVETKSRDPLRYKIADEDVPFINWWDRIPDEVIRTSLKTGEDSNIRPESYAGPESCRKCHKKNYDSWHGHSHRLMNAEATPENVMGDFSPEASITYMGGEAKFWEESEGVYRMSLERDGTYRVFDIHQTIGSRFFQYYIGMQIKGPIPRGHDSYETDHVLPFGYWLDQKEWVPVVHVFPRDDDPDETLTDPFDMLVPPMFAPYATGCNSCHTTFPAGDQFIRRLRTTGKFAPQPMHLAMSEYLGETHPELWSPEEDVSRLTSHGLLGLVQTFENYPATEHAVTLGISCEACHLGAKDHAEGRLKKPKFFPHDPLLRIENTKSIEFGPSHQNRNWACGRCHTGSRPYYAGGMATWNSTEFSDAMKGSCYSKLSCIDCHDPHTGIGPKWKLRPDQDDSSCLKCHEDLKPETDRVAHTHHPMNTSGSRCMNCHMPHINEGMQDMVRTHTIFSPTNKNMLESNSINACNMCHGDKSIDWTTARLKEWYGASFDEQKIVESYPDKSKAVADGWMNSDREAVRLAAAGGLFRSGGVHEKWSLPLLVDALDDPFLINRQFARIGIEEGLKVRLLDYGYRFYMTPEERKKPLAAIRRALLSGKAPSPSEAAAEE